uniref:Uncharacterized protein n=1 Tax=Panagrolaimus sp. ES5 TaxID=591445 RepID=A0AC34G300_9BILA
MKIFQVGLILFFLGFSDGAFTCYHGQGTGSKYVTTECPSKICVIFNAACGQYTSTTCYNDQNPMKVVNAFEGAAFYYKNSAQSTSFGYCNVSECNKWMSQLNNQSVIFSDPSSFDYWLSASVKQEETKKKLQNGITLQNGIGTDETFKFVGQTFKTSKSPWLAFSCTYINGSTMKFQIYFDLKNSKLISKTITVVSKAQKTKQLNETWTNPTKPGGQISIALKNINPGFQLSVNDVVYAKFMNDKTIKNVNLVTYGSTWTMNSTSIV